jgi:glycosyltransferase involved in cell wall biosynthesis
VISVLVLTFNEGVNLKACLESVKWSDDVVVFDSYSSDRTVDVALNFGARVIQRPWDNEREQRTASLRLAFRYPWVYNPDADEVTPPELANEMRSVVADRSRPEVAYRVRFKHILMGRWLKHSSLYPTWVVRLFRPERLRFERTVNLRYVVDGPVGSLMHHFEHYPFNKGLNAWIDKHNKYSWYEAQEALRAQDQSWCSWRGIVTSDRVERRARLKALSMVLPCRPAFRFVYTYLMRGGFLDGRPGLIYCGLMAWYQWMIDLKMKEIELEGNGPRGNGVSRVDETSLTEGHL